MQKKFEAHKEIETERERQARKVKTLFYLSISVDLIWTSLFRIGQTIILN